jgi:hypothetical protein
MSNLPELAPSNSVRSMLYQMAELLIRYPNEADRLATPEALSNPFLVEVPDLVTVVQWLQFLGDDVTADELRAIYAPQGGATPLS